jgi:diguanylate cyclase (GGDEF)-like protein
VENSTAAATEQALSHDSALAALPEWTRVQESLAAGSGCAILLVGGHQPPALAISNNNSLCHAIQSSAEHVRLCDPYCGQAHERAVNAGKVTHYTCHAGLQCFAMPIAIDRERTLAIIGGRAFHTSAAYRALVERLRIGDLRDLQSRDLFKNVIFAAPEDLIGLAERLSRAAADYENQPIAAPTAVRAAAATEAHARKDADPEKAMSQSRSQSLFDDETVEPCRSVLIALAETQGLQSVALLLRDRANFVPVFGTGRFETSPIQIDIGPKDVRLSALAKTRHSIPVDERPRTTSQSGKSGTKSALQKQMTELFPLVANADVKGALIVGDTELNDEKRDLIAGICQELVLPLEVLHLRHELGQRERYASYMRAFSEQINSMEPAEAYVSILRHSAQLLGAERSSLLIFDEASNELSVKASIGQQAEMAGKTHVDMDRSLAAAVLRDGRPLLVSDVDLAGREPAPPERKYKTKSFISYPILLGGRKVGIINVTDKAGGGIYDENDLSLLETIAPQMALALDRAEWREKAVRFQLMSITDPLTGMLNRRYLEDRLTEELNRSQRFGYDMSFMMIDIDDFKVYNDLNGHQAGDLALEMTAQCLKSALRAADVASRYGGEEFCILLPQTTLSEAKIIAERIRRRVERTRYPHGGNQPLGAVTVSIGLSSFIPTQDTSAAIIGAADRALYLAKYRGKNRVESFELESSSSPKPDAPKETEQQRQP